MIPGIGVGTWIPPICWTPPSYCCAFTTSEGLEAGSFDGEDEDENETLHGRNPDSNGLDEALFETWARGGAEQLIKALLAIFLDK